MPRTISTPNLTALTSQLVQLCLLVRLDFTPETLRLASTPFPIVWGGYTWTGAGAVGSVSGLTEDSQVSAQGMQLTLTAIPAEYVADALAVVKYGGLGQVYLGFLAGGALIADPIPIFSGLVDQPSFSIDGQTAMVTISLESVEADLQRAQGGRYTGQDQRSRYPGDASLDYVSLIQDKLVLWK